MSSHRTESVMVDHDTLSHAVRVAALQVLSDYLERDAVPQEQALPNRADHDIVLTATLEIQPA